MNKKYKAFLITLIILIAIEAIGFGFAITAAQSNNTNQQTKNIQKEIIEDGSAEQDKHTDISYKSYDVQDNNAFKSFMDYRTITDVSSKQYALQQYYAKTSSYGIRAVSNRFCIALGSYFSADIGQWVDLVLENGTVIRCIMADLKDDVDTDDANIATTANGCISEFIVDTPELDDSVKLHGNVSYCTDEWDSPIVSVKVYNNNVFDFD